jgi:peptidoglycan hydrolase-like protein with peptidoglycan-binding domain
MDAWLTGSPYWAVGIYISGKSRACRSQPNLTPTWVSTQIRNGWRLLPITLGPQASCSTRFPRYGTDPVINATPTDNYAKARAMGRAEARDAVSAAQGLGIVPGSTLWYDLEGFAISQTRCRESAIRFTSAWTRQLHDLGYVSGFYSSASSGIKMLDDVRATRPSVATLPDRIWIADWNGRADVESSYLRSDGWKPGNRMHQYRGGHDETYGGVRINIDTDFLDLGNGSRPTYKRVFCGGVRMDWTSYALLKPGATGDQVTALQCLMTNQGFYQGPLNGRMDTATVAAVQAVRKARALPAGTSAGARVWMTLHLDGPSWLMKYGAAGESVRRLQRGLDSLYPSSVPVSGTFEARTTTAVKRYQADLGLTRSGVVTLSLWTRLKRASRG